MWIEPKAKFSTCDIRRVCVSLHVIEVIGGYVSLVTVHLYQPPIRIAVQVVLLQDRNYLSLRHADLYITPRLEPVHRPVILKYNRHSNEAETIVTDRIRKVMFLHMFVCFQSVYLYYSNTTSEQVQTSSSSSVCLSPGGVVV